jgi:glucose-6-phosphate 1-dehydrogenase
VAAAVHAAGDAPVVAYLALPQRAAAPAVRSLVAAGLPAGSRVAVEKPFGEDLASAVALNALLAELAGSRGEDAVFRVDHALGMRAVQDLAGRDWDGADVEELEVLWEETLALEGRAGFYDAAGALKDVLQNHMLQVLSVIAMEPHDGADVRDAKVAALRATSAVGSSRARYTAGRDVPAYAEESGVDPGRGTETFAEVLLSVDTPRWAGTRVRLRAGKALARGFKGAIVHHRSAQAEHIAVDRTGEGELSAYERVLLDVLGGASTLSVRGDEAEEAWRIVTPVLAAWADGVVGLDEYPAGSDGPPRIVP